MKYLWVFLILGASAFGQNLYGPDFLNLHCTSVDPLSNTVFNIPPRPGLVPNTAPSGNAIIYCDASSGTIKMSFSGAPFASITPLGLLTPFYPEGFISWNPGTIYPAILSGTCVFAASTTCTVNYPATWSSIPVVNITPVNPGAVTFTLTTSSTSQIIITGSTSNSLTVNYTAVLPAGQNCTVNQVFFPLPGSRANADFVIPEWPSTLPANLDGMMRVVNADTVEVRLCNPTSATVTFSGALTFGAKLFR